MKREDYISWDEYFMGIAMLSAMRSKDNNSQVGACIVSPENKILSLGYNGMPIGCNDDDMPKAIIQSGIKELIYLSDKYHDTHASIASRRMFNMTGVKYRAYEPTGRKIELEV